MSTLNLKSSVYTTPPLSPRDHLVSADILQTLRMCRVTGTAVTPSVHGGASQADERNVSEPCQLSHGTRESSMKVDMCQYRYLDPSARGSCAHVTFHIFWYEVQVRAAKQFMCKIFIYVQKDTRLSVNIINKLLQHCEHFSSNFKNEY